MFSQWYAGICPIAAIVRNTTSDDDIKTHDRHYLLFSRLLAMAYPTKKKRSV